MTSRLPALVAAIGLTLGLAACETATPYQPLQRGSHVAGGYSEQKLDADHFQVSFAGNTDTPRTTVESYLLYRAAEVTLAQGYDWFETVERHTEREKRTYIDPDPFYGPGYAWGGFRPYWNYWGPGYGWAGWGPYWGADIYSIQKFEATAEITLHHGPKPPGHPRGLDAREVVTNLGPKIQRPKT
jgi:hypothetical protein